MIRKERNQVQGRAEPQTFERPQVQDEPKPPFPGQKQPKPGIEARIDPRPRYEADRYRPADKLRGKKALITGGDSGIGRAVAVLYAREGADVAINYLEAEQVDADETREAVESHGRRCICIPGDLSQPAFCRELVERCRSELGGLDILVSNAAYQNHKSSFDELTEEEWRHTFAVNIDAYFYLVKAAVPHMKAGSSIIATTSVQSYQSGSSLADYAATKGAITSFTKALGKMLAEKGIRVNAVAPGPVWTPLNIADKGQSEQSISKFGGDVPLQRPGQPEEMAPAYVFLASDPDSSYVTGSVITETGGESID